MNSVVSITRLHNVVNMPYLYNVTNVNLILLCELGILIN